MHALHLLFGRFLDAVEVDDRLFWKIAVEGIQLLDLGSNLTLVLILLFARVLVEALLYKVYWLLALSTRVALFLVVDLIEVHVRLKIFRN